VHGVAVDFPPLILLRAGVAAVWLYEGLWCKLLGRVPSQVAVASSVPWVGPRRAAAILRLLGLAEVAIAVWVVAGAFPEACALIQTLLLVTLNASGLVWGRQAIHDPAGMVVENVAFLLLVWVCGAAPGVLK
jgi:hypothetical protein